MSLWLDAIAVISEHIVSAAVFNQQQSAKAAAVVEMTFL